MAQLFAHWVSAIIRDTRRVILDGYSYQKKGAVLLPPVSEARGTRKIDMKDGSTDKKRGQLYSGPPS